MKPPLVLSAPRYTGSLPAPRAYLENCLARVEAAEPVVQALAAMDARAAREAAEASDKRWRAGDPLSPIDGMPIALKDIFETADLPTGFGSPVFEGRRGGRDSAIAFALREAGAIVLAKTVTTEFAGAAPAETRNPHDPARTPGGSSSGSAAAVAAGMVPVAIGSQVGGSILRPASFCGVIGYKPTFGALNRGGISDNFSQNCAGTLSSNLEDAWAVCHEIARRVGGDPGFPPFAGGPAPAPARKPGALAVLRTAGWAIADGAARSAFDEFCGLLRSREVRLASAGDSALVARLEGAIADASKVSTGINDWEKLWPFAELHRREGARLSAGLREGIETGRAMTPDAYCALLLRRDAMREALLALAGEFEGCITLAAPGAAPVGLATTGNPIFNHPGSALRCPAMSLPVLAAEGLPLGLQLLGFPGRDRDLSAIAGYCLELAAKRQSTPDQANLLTDPARVDLSSPARRGTIMLNGKLSRRGLLAAATTMPLLAASRRAGAREHAMLVEGAKREGKMSLATSVSQANFPAFMQAFTSLYPFLDVNTGYYAAPTGRVLARVEAERRGGALSFDVMHIASVAPYLTYAREGKLLPYRSPELAAYPPLAGDPAGNWTTARVIGVIMAYSKNYLSPDKAPRSWADALKPEFAGRKLVLQDAAAGTAFAQMYELERHLGADYLKRLSAQKPMVVATAAQVIDLLVRGEALVGFTVDQYRAFEPDAVKAGIMPVYPTEGMPIALAPVAIFRDAPHPNAAKLFVDFVLSHDGQMLLCHDIFQVYSMRRDVPPPAGQLPYADTKPMLPGKEELGEYERALAAFPEKFEALFQLS